MPPPPAVRVRALALAAALLAAAPGAAGQEDGGQARKRAAASAASQRLLAFGNWCRGRSMKAFARRAFEEALLLDPADPAIRAALGHRMSDGKWIPPEKREALSDAVVATPMGIAAFEKEAEAAWADCAGAYADLAAWSAGELRDADARDAWWRVLSFRPGHPEARRQLGLEEADTAWLRPLPDGPAAFDARCRKALEPEFQRLRQAAAPVEQPAVVDGGRIREEIRGPRFEVSCTVPKVRAADLLEDLDRTDALWTSLGVLPARKGGEPRFRYEAVGTIAEYEKLVDAAEGQDASWRAAHKKVGGFWIESKRMVMWGDSEAWVRDWAVHSTSHVLLDALAPWSVQAWWKEGTAVFAATMLRGGASSFCVSLEESASGRKGLTNMDWNEEVRRLIRTGGDPPLSELMPALTNDLSLPAVLKGRSMAAWTLQASPPAFAEVLRRSTKDAAPDKVIRESFGCPPEAVERRWRLWALRP